MNARLAICLFAATIPIVAASAQEPSSVLTLAQATDAALAQGADSRILLTVFVNVVVAPTLQ